MEFVVLLIHGDKGDILRLNGINSYLFNDKLNGFIGSGILVFVLLFYQKTVIENLQNRKK